VLPNSDAEPSCFSEPPVGVLVAQHVGLSLLGPKVGVRDRCGVVLGAAMPEASIEEDSNFGRRKNKVSSPSQLLERSR
jgi:hypothetical protein